MPRETFANQSLGHELYGRLKQSRVLMVGAGGIGCELLKNLVLMGFQNIHIVDLDTIDLSNLNRQFLFRHEHIKKPKALVAKESAGKFNPNVNIEAYHANIKESRFDIDWFKTFDIVFNALDNMDARRHVNEMCIAADIPLVESGTTGFAGQTSVIKRGVTECYDCYEKETPKSFPVCTIRSTPSQPIHCIVWAKSYLFTEVFGTGEEAPAELDMTVSEENAQDIARLREETLALQKIRAAMGTDDFPRLVFDKVFNNDVHELLRMEDMWKSKKAPKPYAYSELKEKELPAGKDTARQDQGIWSPEESFAVFLDSLHRLTDRYLELKKGDDAPQLAFDKDDPDTLDFVAAAANLRSYIFSIDPKSKFDIKQMAGNIIPAIATTNAIIAGACVLQAIKVFRGAFEKAPMFMTTKSTDRLMVSERAAMRPPNPNCPVCGVARTRLVVDPKRARLSSLVDALKTDLGYSDDITIYSDAGMIYENDEDFEDNLTKYLSELSISANSKLRIEEETRVNLLLSIRETTDESSPALEISEKIIVPAKLTESNGTAQTNGVQVNGDSNGGDSNGVDSTPSLATGTKRKLEEATEERPTAKVKTGDGANGASENGNPLVVDDDGAIVLD